MDQHPIPRQITTFEFKLIGFFTLKQFIYLVIFIPLGYVVFKIFPVPIINIVLGLIVAGIGVALAFIPINDRPLEIWIGNLIKRLTSATQYVYLKENKPIYFLKNLFFSSDPHRVMTHVESQEKLAAYLLTKRKSPNNNNPKKKIEIVQDKPEVVIDQKKNQKQEVQINAERSPFFAGIVKNHKLIPLPGILIYIKDENGKIVRLVKTNPHGVFATFSKLAPAEYNFEFKDPKNTYFFDTIKIKAEEQNPKPFEFFSKELI